VPQWGSWTALFLLQVSLVEISRWTIYLMLKGNTGNVNWRHATKYYLTVLPGVPWTHGSTYWKISRQIVNMPYVMYDAYAYKMHVAVVQYSHQLIMCCSLCPLRDTDNAVCRLYCFSLLFSCGSNIHVSLSMVKYLYCLWPEYGVGFRDIQWPWQMWRNGLRDLKRPLNKGQGHSFWYQSISQIRLPIGC